MSATLATILRPAVTKRSGAFSRLLSVCCDEIVRYLIHRAAIATLREFDDRALSDIGIARCQIEAAVHGFSILPEQSAIRTSSAATGLRADGRLRAPAADVATWS
jgi:uncharacterized protein YjiS (DUF1127 family)